MSSWSAAKDLKVEWLSGIRSFAALQDDKLEDITSESSMLLNSGRIGDGRRSDFHGRYCRISRGLD
jgi:hypothetical protein